MTVKAVVENHPRGVDKKDFSMSTSIRFVDPETVVAVLLPLLRVVERGLFGQGVIRSIRDRIKVNHVLPPTSLISALSIVAHH